MLYGIVLVIHVILCIFLVVLILIQGGRGGLGEMLGGSGSQSLFGGGANIVMTKVTAGLGIAFLVTCLSLAGLSTARGRSVIEKIPLTLPDPLAPLPAPAGASPAAAPTQPAPAPEAAAPQTNPASGSSETPSSGEE